MEGTEVQVGEVGHHQTTMSLVDRPELKVKGGGQDRGLDLDANNATAHTGAAVPSDS